MNPYDAFGKPLNTTKLMNPMWEQALQALSGMRVLGGDIQPPQGAASPVTRIPYGAGISSGTPSPPIPYGTGISSGAAPPSVPYGTGIASGAASESDPGNVNSFENRRRRAAAVAGLRGVQ
jgi:hypothetical protein